MDNKQGKRPGIRSLITTDEEFEVLAQSVMDAHEAAGYPTEKDMLKKAQTLVGKEASNKKYQLKKISELHCLIKASEKWETEIREKKRITKMGDMAEFLKDELVKLRMQGPEPLQIREWLKGAARKGLIDIPSDATKGGRPKKDPH